jgi:hypothetical protein
MKVFYPKEHMQRAGGTAGGEGNAKARFFAKERFNEGLGEYISGASKKEVAMSTYSRGSVSNASRSIIVQ